LEKKIISSFRQDRTAKLIEKSALIEKLLWDTRLTQISVFFVFTRHRSLFTSGYQARNNLFNACVASLYWKILFLLRNMNIH